MRGSRRSACASQSCISRRVSASSAANGSSRHRTGLPESSVRRKATRWRMPPESSWGRARSKPSRPKAAKSGCARARACSRDAPARRRASAALSIARSQGSRPSRWGMSTAGSARTLPASGAWSPHTSSSRVVLPQPLGPTTATISPAPTSRSTPSSARTAPKARLRPPGRRAAPFNVSRLLCRSLELRRHRSLRGHYPTGSKGQRRFPGRYLSRPPPAPLFVCGGC